MASTLWKCVGIYKQISIVNRVTSVALLRMMSAPTYEVDNQREFVLWYEDMPEVQSLSEDRRKIFDLKYASQRDLNKVDIHQMMQKLQKTPSDTGSTAVQVGVLTLRIRYLNEHMKIHKKDFSCKRVVQMMVDKRRRLLKYLRRTDLGGYHSLLEQLNIRPIVDRKYPT
ncbi:small ribosomal subunit protein uS15-like [Corticium candelabrum]|uniref:small ribosomal subunit protein uS15-like n=1 Tax=Corticium candelabrum TaxID=121492 RepID=UPI002E269E63|nr:small ribosomal subunit protein uS15-like [Corticium candelabrum]